MEHRRKFADKKLADALCSLSDLFKQVFEGVFNPKSEHAKNGVSNVDSILKGIEQFKTGLVERGILGAYEGIMDNLEIVTYSLHALRTYFLNASETHMNDKDAYIFADFAERRMQKLLKSAKDLDEDYDPSEPCDTIEI